MYDRKTTHLIGFSDMLIRKQISLSLIVFNDLFKLKILIITMNKNIRNVDFCPG